MKNYLIVLIGIVAVSCSSDYKEIEAVAQNYLQAMGDYRIEDAVPYASSYTRENTIPVLKHIMDHADTTYINSNKPSVITITKTDMLSDTTARVFYHKHTPIKDVDDDVLVVLENGQWLVDVRVKSLPFNSSQRKMEHIPTINPSDLHKISPDSLDRNKLRHH